MGTTTTEEFGLDLVSNDSYLISNDTFLETDGDPVGFKDGEELICPEFTKEQGVFLENFAFWIEGKTDLRLLSMEKR